jgi:hypothetical protein
MIAMKTTHSFVIASLCGTLTLLGLTEKSRAAAADSSSSPPASLPPPNATAVPPASRGQTDPASAAKTAAADSSAISAGNALAAPPANQPAETALVHTGASTFGSQTDPANIATPPPPLRPEKKPPAPDSTYIWVPGHYTPSKGEWQWVAGKWGVPATPTSVWIEGKYDSDAKRWNEGYWQPGGTVVPDVEAPKSGPPVASQAKPD